MEKTTEGRKGIGHGRHPSARLALKISELTWGVEPAFVAASVAGTFLFYGLNTLMPASVCGSIPNEDSQIPTNSHFGGTLSRVKNLAGWLARHSHHQGDGTTSSVGPVSMSKERRAVCSGGLVVAIEAAVLLKLGLSPSEVGEAGHVFLLITRGRQRCWGLRHAHTWQRATRLTLTL